MPEYKEAQIFCKGEEEIPDALERFMVENFSGLGSEVKLGKVATHYMMGFKQASVSVVVERVARTLPNVRLIALLRDPIERAISHYCMSYRRAWDGRSLDQAIEGCLESEALAIARSHPTETNSYVVQGEYGRILRCFRKRFSAEQIHVEMTADLERDSPGVLDRVIKFLHLPVGYRPSNLGMRYHVGGMEPRLDRSGEAQLRAFMVERTLPQIPNDLQRHNAELAFAHFFETWNVVPAESQPPLNDRNRKRLEKHYRQDGERLDDLGIQAPWLEAWSGFGSV